MVDSPWDGVPPDLEVRWSSTLEPMGGYDPVTHTIWMRTGLTQAERRSTLAHELEHARKGDPCVHHILGDWHEGKQESHVSELAARALIPLPRLIDALMWSQDEIELADELWVDRDTVLTRLETLTEHETNQIDAVMWAEERGA